MIEITFLLIIDNKHVRNLGVLAITIFKRIIPTNKKTAKTRTKSNLYQSLFAHANLSDTLQESENKTSF